MKQNNADKGCNVSHFLNGQRESDFTAINQKIRHQSEKTLSTLLKQARENFDLLFDKSPVGHITLDSQHQIIRYNHCAAKLLASSLDKQLIFSLLPAHLKQRFFLMLKTAAQDGQYGPIEMNISKDFQHPIWVSVTIHKLPTSNGPSYLCTFLSIADKIKYQNLASLHDTIPETFPDTLMEIDQAGKITSLLSTGQDSACFISPPRVEQYVHDIFISDIVSPLLSQIDNSLKNQDAVITFETTTPVPYEIRLVAQNADHVLAIIREVTLRKSTNNQQHNAEVLAALEALTNGIAHEFNNLCTPMSGHLERLLKDPSISESGVKRLHTINGCINKIKHLTQNLRQITPEQKQAINIRPINPSTLIHDTLSLLNTTLFNQDLHITLELDDSITLLGDEWQLGQVIMNLLLNAYHSMLDQSFKEILVRTRQVGDEIHISIKDYGHGIAEKHLHNIFTPLFTTKGEFAQSNSQLATIKSSGLGLSICKKLVENHNGHIQVESAVARGSTFTVCLPATCSAPSKQSARSLQKKILIIDERKIILEYMQELLQSRYQTVDTCDNEIDALHLIEHNDYDLLISDWSSAQINGQMLLEKITALKLTSPPHIIIYAENHELVRQIPGTSPIKILPKPFNENELFSLIDNSFI